MTLRWDADFQDFRQDEPDTWEVTYSYRPGITKMALREYLVGIGPVRNECGSPSKNGISRIASGKESIPGNRKAKAESLGRNRFPTPPSYERRYAARGFSSKVLEKVDAGPASSGRPLKKLVTVYSR
jgi:hypothetical protein